MWLIKYQRFKAQRPQRRRCRRESAGRGMRPTGSQSSGSLQLPRPSSVPAQHGRRISPGALMFLTYLRRELRRRARQAILIALGLAIGVGLVITVTAASAGVKNAQSDVLHSLYGVGTDITVTQAPAAGAGGPGGFGFGFSGGPRSRPAPGSKFSSNRLSSGRLGPIGAGSVTSIAHLARVAAATGSLRLSAVAIPGPLRPAGAAIAAARGRPGRASTPPTPSRSPVSICRQERSVRCLPARSPRAGRSQRPTRPRT